MSGPHRITIVVLGISALFVTSLGGCKKEVDLPLECGDVRGGVSTTSANIVNGSSSWDPAVVPLTDGQALAIGAVMMDDGWGNWSSICTGTIVGPKLALMAAHCVVDRRGRVQQPSEFGFGIGGDVERLRAVLRPSQVVVDPYYNYRSSGAGHDQALFVFDAPVTDEVPDLVPIPFNRETLDPVLVVGEDVQTVGFGCIDSNCDLYNNLRWWAVEELYALSSFDLTVDGHGIAGVCYGDSGGPVLRSFPGEGIKTLGTLSWGDPSCSGLDHYAQTSAEAHFLDTWAPGCGQVTAQGSCDANVATYCENDTVVTLDCGAASEVCQADVEGFNRCIDPCSGETLQGRCDGEDAIWCENGSVKVRRCAECGLTCAGGGTGQLADCI